ncbi:MAG: hypothetical protein LLG04_16930 [Parachlamydia sp.]|nr:hypothetical protein [Parachlamydia sp.]
MIQQQMQESAVKQAHLRNAIENASKAEEISKASKQNAAESDRLSKESQEKLAQAQALRKQNDENIKRIIGSALYTMVAANFMPAQQGDREAAKHGAGECTQVIMPFLNMIMTGSMKESFEIVPTKGCAKLPPAALTQIVVPLLTACCEKSKKQKLILNLSEFKNELPELGPFLSGELRISELKIGGLFKDPKADPSNPNTTLDNTQIAKLARAVAEMLKTRPIAVKFAEEELNNRFSQLLAETSVKKTPPAVPPKPNKSATTVSIPMATGGTNTIPPHVQGSPPKGQA